MRIRWCACNNDDIMIFPIPDFNPFPLLASSVLYSATFTHLNFLFLTVSCQLVCMPNSSSNSVSGQPCVAARSPMVMPTHTPDSGVRARCAYRCRDDTACGEQVCNGRLGGSGGGGGRQSRSIVTSDQEQKLVDEPEMKCRRTGQSSMSSGR